MDEPQMLARVVELLDQPSMVVPYRPVWVPLAGSVTAAILLQQVLYRWQWNHYRPFYKFKEPCAHPFYRPGDSWTEELNWTRREFDSARRRIAQARGETIGRERPVVYWTTAGRLTFYAVNLAVLLDWLHELPAVERPDSIPTRGVLRRRVAADSAPSGGGLRRPAAAASAGTISENTPDIPAEKGGDGFSFAGVQAQLAGLLNRATYEALVVDLQAEQRPGELWISGPERSIAWLQARLHGQVEAAVRAAAEAAGVPAPAVRYQGRQVEG